jgi:hypothetical protein
MGCSMDKQKAKIFIFLDFIEMLSIGRGRNAKEIFMRQKFNT